LPFLAALDVFVLTGTLRALLDAAWGHCDTSFSRSGSRFPFVAGGNRPRSNHRARKAASTPQT
jgi:hypothetical protein